MNFGFFDQAKYLVDEAKDKNNRILDVSKWESVFPQDIPEQLNGYVSEFFADMYVLYSIFSLIPGNDTAINSEILFFKFSVDVVCTRVAGVTVVCLC